MAKAPQVLRLDPPSELVFNGPFTEVVTAKLQLENPTERIVYFKVKTTAPKHYCVRPNSGVISGNGMAEINVLLQPVENATVLEREGAKHKFMIQSAFSNVDTVPVDDFWKNVNGQEIMDSKLRVTFNIAAPTSTASAHSAPIAPPANITPVAAKRSPSPVKPSNEPAQTASDDKSAMMKRVEEEKKQYERENRQLRDELSKMARQVANSSATEQGIPMIQVVLLSFAILLIGLILGKMF